MASEALLSAGIGLIGAVIGAAIAGGCSYWATYEQLTAQRRRDEEEAKRQAKNVVRMNLLIIREEIKNISYTVELMNNMYNEDDIFNLKSRSNNINKIFGNDTCSLDDYTFSSLSRMLNCISSADDSIRRCYYLSKNPSTYDMAKGTIFVIIDTIMIAYNLTKDMCVKYQLDQSFFLVNEETIKKIYRYRKENSPSTVPEAVPAPLTEEE